MRLTTDNFFNHLIFHPFEAKTSKEKVIALIASATCAFFTLGLCHVLCAWRCYTLKVQLSKLDHTTAKLYNDTLIRKAQPLDFQNSLAPKMAIKPADITSLAQQPPFPELIANQAAKGSLVKKDSAEKKALVSTTSQAVKSATLPLPIPKKNFFSLPNDVLRHAWQFVDLADLMALAKVKYGATHSSLIPALALKKKEFLTRHKSITENKMEKMREHVFFKCFIQDENTEILACQVKTEKWEMEGISLLDQVRMLRIIQLKDNMVWETDEWEGYSCAISQAYEFGRHVALRPTEKRAAAKAHIAESSFLLRKQAAVIERRLAAIKTVNGLCEDVMHVEESLNLLVNVENLHLCANSVVGFADLSKNTFLKTISIRSYSGEFDSASLACINVIMQRFQGNRAASVSTVNSCFTVNLLPKN